MPHATTNHDLPNDQRWSLYHDLLENKRNGRLPRGKAAELLKKYGISKQTLSKIWNRGQQSTLSGRADVASLKKGRSGRPPKRSMAEIEAAVKSVQPHLRKTFAMLAASSGIPSTTLWRVLQTKKLQRRTSRLKPMVTDKHKADRVAFVRSFVRTGPNGQMRWDEMLDRVHIDEKWFYQKGRRSQAIYIQQDNARPHVEVDDPAVMMEGSSEGWTIHLTAQPAMSPDFNVLDLGFFNSIQALQHREVVTGIDDLVAAVHRAFDDLDWRVLDKTFATLQRVMGESLKTGGDNAFKLPHLQKDKKARLGPVPPVVCDPDVVKVIEAMNARKDFERRVDNLPSVLSSCDIEGVINTSNIDHLCTLVEAITT
ncbi:hypothetical protein AeMF1_017394 [Aphanomyces euteiches]|nr:hypothetical protein AeMF1_017394 [Aphanomyces euteiches]